MNYPQTVHYLFNSLPVFQHSGGAAYKPGLQTARELDAFFDYPHRKYTTIHVAGTNGKGSVSHMLAAVLQGNGYKTGLFTSPHLEDFRERIKINGTMITEEEVVAFVRKGRAVFDRVQPSFFEMTTAMAFDHFARNHADIAIIETGMGGRLDSTNIIRPAMSVITNVSMDHTQFLGNNPISIAAEKAGIIKPGIPVTVGETQAGPEEVFREVAEKLEAPIFFADQSAKITKTERNNFYQTFHIRQNGKELPSPLTIDLGGDYQQKNIITVLIALQCLIKYANTQISYEKMVSSLKNTVQMTGFRGRWQILRQTPPVICDAAHNPAGMAWVVKQIGSLKYDTLRMVTGFVRDKDISGMLELLPRNARYYFTQAAIPRAMKSCDLKADAERFQLLGNCYSQVSEAVNVALEDAAANDLIFVGGSIFVVAEAIKALERNGC
jgi:dihydrofolate synthase/folylpolyglutamate synthase